MFDSLLLLNGNTWLIIGLLLILIEMIDGSLIVFLPTGLSGLITGTVLKLQEGEFIPIILNDWVWASVLWSFVAVVISILLRNLFKTSNPDEDVNNY